MRFIGCAPAWRPGDSGERASCLVVLDERGSIIHNSFVGGAGEISAAAEAHAREGAIIGLDAPLSVPNERGTRKVEKVLAKLSLPAYSASRRMFDGTPFMEEVLKELEAAGFEYTDYPFPRERGRHAVEVDSQASLKVVLYERSGDGGEDAQEVARKLRELPEARLRKGNKSARAEAIKSAISTLWDTKGLRLRTGNLSGDIGSPENVDVSKLDVNAQMSHAELDRVVSLVEGILAAYTVHRHWRGRDGSAVVGLGDEGSVLLPANEALQRALAEECRVSKVAYV